VPRVRRDFERPAPADVAALGGLATTILSDVMGRTGAMDSRVRPVSAALRMAGPALTVRLYPNDNLMCHLAVHLARPGDVLVIDAGRYLDAAVWGGMLTRAALARGVAGVVVDGAVRDRDDIETLGLPVFAAAVVPRGTHKQHAGDGNQPVSCGGIAVEPGDVVVTDADGVVVVPRSRVAEVIQEGQAAQEGEAGWVRALAGGQTLYEMAGIEGIVDRSGVEWE
jgi:4-hydroxy-4-methyl-2-oxoglutarate aldolase